MIHDPLVYLAYPFGIKALIASVMSGFILSSLGVYIVLRKMAFMGAGLAHVAFAGVAFGLLIGNFPIFWGIVFTQIAGYIIWYFSSRKMLQHDVTMGIIFAASMGLAVLFLGLSNHYGAEALGYLFGSPLTVTDTDLALLSMLFIITTIFIAFYYKEIYLICFSEDIAKASGCNVNLTTFLITVLVSSSVVVSMKAVGAILVFSLLVIPAASAFRLSKSYNQMFVLSIAFGTLSATIGIFLSFSLDIPSGASITLVSVGIFALTVLFKSF